MPVPVVVVGNLTVGGTGKTPIALWLGRQLQLRGHRVGIVLRGYGARHSGAPRVVTAADDPAEVGDEALLHARRGPQVVVIGADRVAAARLAVEQGARIVVCDDGLQHLRLARDYEIAVVDAARGFGNRLLLPAGPLREPASRLETVDAVVLARRGASAESALRPRRPFVAEARFDSGPAVNLRSGERRELATFRGDSRACTCRHRQSAGFFRCIERSRHYGGGATRLRTTARSTRGTCRSRTERRS